MDSMISILFTGLLSSSTRYFSSGVLLIQMDRAEAISPTLSMFFK